MKKKVEKKVVSAKTTSEVTGTEVLTKSLIAKISLDTGRGDLNQLVDKVNEIIEFINK